jgi:hypothetical protein
MCTRHLYNITDYSNVVEQMSKVVASRMNRIMRGLGERTSVDIVTNENTDIKTLMT